MWGIKDMTLCLPLVSTLKPLTIYICLLLCRRREHIVRHKAHSHKHMPASLFFLFLFSLSLSFFLQLVIFTSVPFNRAIIIISPTFWFTRTSGSLCGEAPAIPFWSLYFKMSDRVITRGIFNSFPICGHLERSRSRTHTHTHSHTPARAHLYVVYTSCACVMGRGIWHTFAPGCLGVSGSQY